MSTDNKSARSQNTAKSKASHATHEFGPFYDENSTTLILGSFPSVKSREQQFYYGHPQNRFWKLLGRLCEEEVPVTIAGKKEFLRRQHIALWDVIEECDIVGSSDSSIRNVIPTDLEKLLAVSPIQTVIANGAKSYELLCRYHQELLDRQETQEDFQVVKLPSTSPANAAWSLDKLTEAWTPYLYKRSL